MNFKEFENQNNNLDFDDEEADNDIFNIGLSLNQHGFFFDNIEKLEELNKNCTASKVEQNEVNNMKTN